MVGIWITSQWKVAIRKQLQFCPRRWDDSKRSFPGSCCVGRISTHDSIIWHSSCQWFFLAEFAGLFRPSGNRVQTRELAHCFRLDRTQNPWGYSSIDRPSGFDYVLFLVARSKVFLSHADSCAFQIKTFWLRARSPCFEMIRIKGALLLNWERRRLGCFPVGKTMKMLDDQTLSPSTILAYDCSRATV